MAYSLKNIVQGVSSFFTSARQSSVIGIDIGSSFLKVVQLKKKNGKAILETYGMLALGPYAELSVGQATRLSGDALAGAMKDLFSGSGVTSANSGISIPLGSSLLSVIKMPVLTDKQLAKMIPIEARKYIPVPISEVTLDWQIIPRDDVYKRDEDTTAADNEADEKESREGEGNVDVLIVAIHNDVINKYNDIARATALNNTFFELEVFSLGRSVFGGGAHSSAMTLDMGASTTKIAIMEKGLMKSQHIINRGSQDITRAISQSLGISIEKAEQLKREVGLTGEGDKKEISESISLVLDNIFTEANRILLNYQRKHNKVIDKVVLAGGGSLLKGLYTVAQDNLETNVVFADPFSRLESPAFLEPVLKDAGPEFATAIGIALRKLQELE